MGLIIPKAGKKSSAEAIFEVLSEEWPLSVRELYNKTRRKYALEITYQAIHKKVKEMENSGILKKIDQKYELNLQWVANEKELLLKIEKRYNKESLSLAQVENTGTTNYSFKTPMELARFVIDFATEFPNPENKPTIFKWWSLYPTFSLSDAEYKKMKDAIKLNELYITGNCSTPLDKSLEEEYKKLGAKVQLKSENPQNPDTLVRGDYVCYIYYPPKFRIQWKKYCESKGLQKKLNLVKLLPHLYETNAKFNVIITKNPEVADIVREQVIKAFKKK